MGKEIYADKKNKIYITETRRGTVEISLKANNSVVCVHLKDVTMLPEFVKKISTLQNVNFTDKEKAK